MIDLRECLFVTFTYDHAAGVFYANLSNGARFAVDRSHVGGKLENALNLHKRAVIALNSGKYVQARNGAGKLTYSYTEDQIQRFTEAGFRDVQLPPLELDLADLEL
jgi:hypothetical protein